MAQEGGLTLLIADFFNDIGTKPTSGPVTAFGRFRGKADLAALAAG